MRILLTAAGTPRIEMALRNDGMPILGFQGNDAEEHRQLIVRLLELVYREPATAASHQIAFNQISQEILKIKAATNLDIPLRLLRLFDLLLLSLENAWLIATARVANNEQIDEQTTARDLIKRQEHLKEILPNCIASLQFIEGGQNLKAENAFLGEYVRLVLNANIYTRHLNYNLQNQKFVATDNLAFFSNPNLVLDDAKRLKFLLKACIVKKIVVIAKQSELVDMESHFNEQIHFFSNLFIVTRPLQDIWLASNNQVVFADEKVHQHYKVLSESKHRLIDVLITEIMAVQHCHDLPETSPHELLIKYDWMRLLYNLKYKLFTSVPDDAGEPRDPRTRNLQKGIESCYLTSVRLLEEYIAQTPEFPNVVQAAELLKLHIDRIHIANILRFGSIMSVWQAFDVDSVKIKKKEASTLLLSKIEEYGEFSIYIHSQDARKPTDKYRINIEYLASVGQLEEVYRSRMQDSLHAVILAENNKSVAMDIKLMLVLQRRKNHDADIKKVFDKVESALAKTLKSKEASALEKMEIRLFHIRATTINYGVDILKQKSPSKKLMQACLKEINEALYALRALNSSHLSKHELMLLELYQIELSFFKSHCLYFLDFSNVEKEFTAAAKQLYAMSPASESLDFEDLDRLTNQIENSKFSDEVPSVLQVVHTHLVNVIVLPLLKLLRPAFEEKNKIVYSQKQVNAALAAARNWEEARYSNDPLTACIAHAWYFKQNETTLAATQFMYSLNQLLLMQSEHSFSNRVTDEFFTLELKATEKRNTYFFWQDKPSLQPTPQPEQNLLQFIDKKISEGHTIYCGCKECNSILGFQFADEQSQELAVKVAESYRFR